MKNNIMRITYVSLLALMLFHGIISSGQVSVLTQHNDSARTGQNLNETTLNTSNVTPSNFGKLFWRTVDGFIFAQPLYLPGVTIQGVSHNIIYVATQHNSVYAFDADDPNSPAPLWQMNLGTPVPSQDICIITGDTNPVDCPYYDISPEVGITSTPVIDSTAGIIYVVARTKNTTNSTYHYFLHALDVASGAERLGAPFEITGQVSGTGTGNQGGIITFDPTYHLQRPSLLLLNGVLYIAFGSQGDIGTWHGWVMSYNATTLQQEAIFNVTPNGDEGGMWSSGAGLVADSSNIYMMSGNGDFTANVSGGKDYGDSFVKFSGPTLAVTDFFTPSNQASLNSGNTDLGAGGPMLIPGTSLLVGQGKDSVFRVVNSTNMGHFNSNIDNDVQEFTATHGPFFSSPIYWNSPNHGPLVYIWGPNDFLKAFQFNGSQFNTAPVSQSTMQIPSGFSNAGQLSVSANGSLTGTGIVWSSAPLSGLATGVPVPGVVRAFDATDLTKELWDSTQNPARDGVGNYAKFVPPTIANGKVYVGSFSGQLQVYGLNPPSSQGAQFVQVASATPQSTTTSVAATYSAPQTAGDLNVVIIGWNDVNAAVQSVIDSAGNTYALVGAPITGTGLRQAIYYSRNIVSSSGNAVTVTFNQGATKPDLRILEYSGVATANPLDVSTGASGNGNIADSGNVTTSAADELIIGADMVSNNTTIMAGAPFNIRAITSPNSDLAADRLVNVPGSYHAWAPLNASGPWIMQVVTFRVATANPIPFVTGVSPSSGPVAGGTAVTITGTNFAAGATVSFGSAAATNVTVVSSTSITATTPAGSAGAVTVTVTNPGSQSGSLSNGFTYSGNGTLAAPTFSPAGGTFSSAQSVSISLPSGATGCYTVDGSTPTATSGGCTHGTSYSSPITVAVSETISALSTESGWTNSSVATAIYTINSSFSTYSDNFTQANGPLSSNWTTPTANETDSGLQIINNQVYAATAPVIHALEIYTGGTFGNNQWSSFTVKNIPSSGNPSAQASLVKGTVSTNYYNDAAPNPTLGPIYRIGNAPGDDFCSVPANTYSAGDKHELDVAGSGPVFFWSKRNGVIDATCLDTTYNLTGGNPGVGFAADGNATPTLALGSWQGGTLPNFSTTPTDNFQRANDGWLGVNWWFPQAGSAFTSYFVLNNNAATPSLSGGVGAAFWTTPFNTNQSSVINIGNLASNDWLAAAVRYTPATVGNDQFYLALVLNNDVELFAYSKGTWALLSNLGLYSGAISTIELDATGNSPVTLTVKVNGVQFGSTFSDSTYRFTGTYAGFANSGTTSSTITGWQGGSL
jgi:hypothetical protein